MALILSAAEIMKAISMKEAIYAVRNAYIDCAYSNTYIPKRTTIEMPEGLGITTVLPAYLSRTGVFGIKVASVFPENPKHDLPLVNAMIVLQDGKTGETIAIMDGRLPTAIKTGAATGVATDVLAKKGARTIGLIGAGYQAARQLEAVCEVRPKISEIWIFDTDKEKSELFARKMVTFLSRFQVTLLQAQSPEVTVRGKDVIITVTCSTTPVFNGEHINEGTHINAVGSFTPEMQEVDETTIIKTDKIVTDLREDALEIAGDLIAPLRKGIVREDIIYCEIGEILTGEKQGRERDDEITLFESIGLAALDVAVAETIYRNALKNSLGKQVNL